MAHSITRVAFVHTGAVVIDPVMRLARQLMPGVEFVNYLDDGIVRDLGEPGRRASVPARLGDLAAAAVTAGAQTVMLTCSSISGLASAMAERARVPVLRIDEAMADDAVSRGRRIAVLATLQTTCEPTVALLRERAARAGRAPTLVTEVVDGAFDAVAAGDRGRHDRLVAAAIARVAPDVDVVVLAQASMASAAATVSSPVPVLTSLESGIRHLRDVVASAPAA